MGKKKRNLLILATARSATSYMAKALSVAGLDVGHEYVGPDGTVSHFFIQGASNFPKPWKTAVNKINEPSGSKPHVGQARDDYEFENIFHQTRHPLKVIGSACGVLFARDWGFIIPEIASRQGKVVGGERVSKVLRCARYWYWWNKIILDEPRIDWRYRIEDLDEIWPELCERTGLSPQPVPEVSRTTNR